MRQYLQRRSPLQACSKSHGGQISSMTFSLHQAFSNHHHVNRSESHFHDSFHILRSSRLFSLPIIITEVAGRDASNLKSVIFNVHYCTRYEIQYSSDLCDGLCMTSNIYCTFFIHPYCIMHEFNLHHILFNHHHCTIYDSEMLSYYLQSSSL